MTKLRKVKVFIVMLLVAVVSLCNSSFLYAKNVYAESIILPLILNQSFETDGGWIVAEDNDNFDESNVSYPTENSYDGQTFLQLTDGEYTVKTNDYIEIDGGDNYVFGIKYIVQDLSSTCQIILETFDRENNLISTITSAQNSPFITDAWADAQVYYNVTQGVEKVKLSIKINATNGGVGIDYAYANKDIIKMILGASISLQEGTTSIRFTGRVDKAVYDGLVDNSVNVGVFIMPTNKYQEVGEFTLKGVSSENGRAIIADNWNNLTTADTDGYYEFACSMGNMHVKEALSLLLSARAFMKLEIDGVERYIYSTFDLTDNSRSVQMVASNLKANSDVYNKYDAVQRAIIDAYALGELPRLK